jgi:hypothetical protein
MNKPFPHSTTDSSPAIGKASAPNALSGAGATPKQPCLSCQGEGEAEWLALDETAPRWLICDDCGGTGLASKPYCEICEGKLSVDHFCYDCDEYTFADRVPPLPEGWLRVAY